MSKNNVSELDVLAANDQDLAGISILGSGLLSTADDSFRTLASFLAKWWDDIGSVNTVGGTANAITVTTPTLYGAFKAGMVIGFKHTAGPNTSATTLNLDALGAKAVRLQGDSALTGGEMVLNGIYLLRYDAAYNTAAGAWVLLNPANAGAAIGVSFVDNVFRVVDNGDATKKLALEVSGITTGTTRTITVPDADFTLQVFATAAQFLANTASKALSTNPVWSAADTVTLTDAATITVDMSTFINASVTLGGNRTLGQPSNTKNGQSGIIRVKQDGTGSRTLAYHADWEFAGASAPTLSTTAAAEDLLFYQVLAANRIFASLVKAVA